MYKSCRGEIYGELSNIYNLKPTKTLEALEKKQQDELKRSQLDIHQLSTNEMTDYQYNTLKTRLLSLFYR